MFRGRHLLIALASIIILSSLFGPISTIYAFAGVNVVSRPIRLLNGPSSFNTYQYALNVNSIPTGPVGGTDYALSSYGLGAVNVVSASGQPLVLRPDPFSPSSVTSSDSSGTTTTSFATSDNVYATVTSTSSGALNGVRLYVTTYSPSTDGQSLVDIFGSATGTVTVDITSSPQTFQVLTATTTGGTFYIVVDTNGDGLWNTGDLVSSAFTIGPLATVTETVSTVTTFTSTDTTTASVTDTSTVATVSVTDTTTASTATVTDTTTASVTDTSTVATVSVTDTTTVATVTNTSTASVTVTQTVTTTTSSSTSSTSTSSTSTTSTTSTTTTTMTTITGTATLNVNLNLKSYKSVNVLVQVCTDPACSLVVGSATVGIGPSHRQGTTAFVLALPPDTYYVRVSDPTIAAQTKIVTFGSLSPQTVTFIIF